VGKALRAKCPKVGTQKSVNPARRWSSLRSVAIRVLCVDDHAVVAEGLRAHFAIDGGIEVVGQLATAAGLVEEAERLCAAVVTLDVEMPGPDAFEMAARLKRVHPEVRVIILSGFVRDAFISAARAAGVSAYFVKSDMLEDIARGIRQVMCSDHKPLVLGRQVQEGCRSPLSRGAGPEAAILEGRHTAVHTRDSRPLRKMLTVREAEILRLIGTGYSRTRIAAQLCRSVKTIDGHQDRMMKKLGIATRTDLVRFAIREGFAHA